MVSIAGSDAPAELDVELKTKSALTHCTIHLLRNIQLQNPLS